MTARLGSPKSDDKGIGGKFRGVLILLHQRPRPLAPGLSRRPSSAAYGPGPSVFTIRANRKATDRAWVSQAVARRGTTALPPMSLGACRGCCRGGTPADASQMSPASEGTPSSLLATSDVGPRTLN